MPSYKRVQLHTLSKDFNVATKIVEEEIPTPAPGHVVVKNHYAGINATDINVTNGAYGATLPCGCGLEAVGTVHSVGSDVKDYHVGDAVIYQQLGAFAEYLEVPQEGLFKTDAVDPSLLALLVSGVSGAVALEHVGEMKTNETVLVTAAAGATGQIVVQLAKLAGNHVIGTCSSEEKAALLKSLGCDRVVNYHTEDLGEVLKKEYPKGVDLVFECVGGKMFTAATENVAVHGRIIIFGYISGYQSGENVHSFSMRPFLMKSASIRGFLLGNHIEHYMSTLRKLYDLYKAKKLVLETDPTEFVGLESIPQAIDHMFAHKNKGKMAIKLV